MSTPTYIYWIHHKDHTDVFSEGYVGVSKNCEHRWYRHQYDASKNKHVNPHFSFAIKKYGWDNLIKKIILIADEHYCYEIESKLRENEKTGWNIAKGGSKPPTLCGESHPMFGKTLSEETRRKISEASKGKIASEETRRKLSEAHKGRIVSEETRRKMSEASKGKIVSEETRKKFSDFNKNDIATKERLKKMSEAKKICIKYKGVEYLGYQQLADFLGINCSAVQKRMQANPQKYGYEVIKK